MALQSSDRLKIGEDPVQKNKGATFQSQKNVINFKGSLFT